MAGETRSSPIRRFRVLGTKKGHGDRAKITMDSMKAFSMSKKVPRRPTMSGGRLEEEKAASEHDYGQNSDENKKGDHLRPRRYLVKLLGMIAATTEL